MCADIRPLWDSDLRPLLGFSRSVSLAMLAAIRRARTKHGKNYDTEQLPGRLVQAEVMSVDISNMQNSLEPDGRWNVCRLSNKNSGEKPNECRTIMAVRRRM